jgi:hypothetical protein
MKDETDIWLMRELLTIMFKAGLISRNEYYLAIVNMVDRMFAPRSGVLRGSARRDAQG